LDENLRYVDIVNFKIANGIYSSRIAYIEEIKRNDIEYEDRQYHYHKSADTLKANSKARMTFKEVFEDYNKLQTRKLDDDVSDEELNLINDEILLIDSERPVIGKAFHKLGSERVKELKYCKGNIETELLKVSDETEDFKIKQLIIEKIGFGVFREDKVIKEIIKNIFNDLGIKRTPKSTLIKKYFETNDNPKSGKRGKIIIREKPIYGLSE